MKPRKVPIQRLTEIELAENRLMSYVYFRVLYPFVETPTLCLKGRIGKATDDPLAEDDICVERLFILVVGGRYLPALF